MTTKRSRDWGQNAWYKFHKKALMYPENPCKCDMQKIYEYYTRIFLDYVGCSSCRNDYLKMVTNIPIRANSRIELFQWSVDIHNMVNAKLDKPQYDYESAFAYWTSQLALHSSKKAFHRHAGNVPVNGCCVYYPNNSGCWYYEH